MMPDNQDTEPFYLSSLGKDSRKTKKKITTYIPEDMHQYLQAWCRYHQETKGTARGAATTMQEALCVWWRKARKQILNGKPVKLPDWQCNLKNTAYADFTVPVDYELPPEVWQGIQQAIKSGHIYANWNKATMAAVARIALQQHYQEHHKYLVRYLQEVAWRANLT